MSEFKKYHPIVNIIYFIFVIGFSMVFMHPVCLGISFVSSFLFSAVLKGKKYAWRHFLCALPLLLAAALINPAFNHSGVTILTYLPSSNPLTLESIVFGFAAGTMVVSVILWFSCYNEIMTSDKFIYLFGKIIPSLSLVLSMTLRFVPRFARQYKVVSDAHKCIGRDVSSGTLIKRAKNSISVLSIMITWSLENAIEISDSMKARGYGLSGRSAFSIFVFDARDACALICIFVLGIYVLIGRFFDAMYFSYFPFMSAYKTNPYSVSVFTAYLCLCVVPIIIEISEAIKWKSIKSKI